MSSSGAVVSDLKLASENSTDDLKARNRKNSTIGGTLIGEYAGSDVEMENNGHIVNGESESVCDSVQFYIDNSIHGDVCR